MRGDSLRDLYAKGLAVLGLALLAGAGALIDLWPSSVEIPRVSRANGLSMPALARMLRADPTSASVPVAAPVRSGAPVVVIARARATRTPSIPEFRVAVSATGLPLAGGVTLDGAAPAFGVRPVSSVTSVGTEVALTSPNFDMAPTSEPTETEPMLSSASQSDDDGFLTDAMKKTGTSILRTGVKTGTSIRDAMRAIGGAVRRAFPG